MGGRKHGAVHTAICAASQVARLPTTVRRKCKHQAVRAEWVKGANGANPVLARILRLSARLTVPSSAPGQRHDLLSRERCIAPC